jgi:hypothetical protein
MALSKALTLFSPVRSGDAALRGLAVKACRRDAASLTISSCVLLDYRRP